MVFNNFDDCIKNFEKIPNMEFDEFCSFFNDVLREFPDRKKYLLDLFYDFENLSVDNESNFIAVADSIVCIYKDVNDLPLLLSYFDDSKEPEWAFDSLMTTVEKYPDPEGIQEILKNTAIFIPKAYYWGGTIIARILHKPQYFKMLKDNLRLANKKELMNILDYMKHNKDSFERVESQIDEILKDLQI